MGTPTSGALVFLCLVISTVNGQFNVPVITNASAINNRNIPESFPVGSEIGRIEAFDPDGKTVSFFLRGDGGEYFSINRATGVLTLKKELDFETDIEIKTTIRVVDADGQAEEEDVKVFVVDENDLEPQFDDYVIYEDISEDKPAGFVVSPISVTDEDTKNLVLTVTCNRSTELFSDACDKFALRKISDSNKFWRGELILRQQLDYEERFSYAILLTAFDGKYYDNNEVHIEVQDINDSPPRFVLAGPSVIDEEEPIGTVFQQVLAEDQDTAEPHPIRYELIGATISIKVTVKDINDNTPTFDRSSYTAIVDENIVSGSNVPGLLMTITDIDSGTFNSFNLVSIEHKDIFAVIPFRDSASASATLYIVNGLKIDYETGPRQYIVQVEARQSNVDNPVRTGTATVTIIVNDVNDITPSFPEDAFRRTVNETDPAGTIIIDLDATDPEEGSFGTAGIKYQLYGNIPPHFNIDEDTGLVTVAQCSTPGVFPCIDYERKQRYTLTASATDNNGLEDGRTRSVPLVIDVNDENDVAPSMEALYERYILENERVTINPLRIDATDPDTLGGPLTYTIVGDTTGLWQVETQRDPTTNQLYGNITAVRPILYEDAPNQATGQFRFALQVKDKFFTTTADIIINVLDINNNAPAFIQREYVEYIPENTAGDTFVIRVAASDGDAPSTGNGILDISVGTGGRGKFYATNISQQQGQFLADIYTTPEATFNFDTDDLYEME
ncbi:cadherin-87A, partial [Elysia marginata]